MNWNVKCTCHVRGATPPLYADPGLLPGSVPAATLERLSLDDLITKSRVIVRGKVLMNSYTATSGPVIYTHYRIYDHAVVFAGWFQRGRDGCDGGYHRLEHQFCAGAGDGRFRYERHLGAPPLGAESHAPDGGCGGGARRGDHRVARET
jgi:hypothetical protein